MMLVDSPREGEKVADKLDCAECGHKARTVCRWNAKARSYEVVCGGCGSDEHLTARPTLTQMWRDDPESIPIQIRNTLERKYGGTPMSDTARALVPVEEKETAIVKRMEEIRFLPDLKPHERRELARIGVAYDLDLFMGELSWYESKPYITMAGYQGRARRSGELRGVMSMPMTREQREQYGEPAKAPFAYICTVRVRGWPDPVYGTGYADPKNPYRKNPVEVARPDRMAEARSIRNALKKAFPSLIPPGVGLALDVDDQGRVSAEVEEPQNVTVIDGNTGEILSGPKPAPQADEPLEPPLGEIEDEAPDLATEIAKDLRGQIEKIVTDKGYGWLAFQINYELKRGHPFAEASVDQLRQVKDTVDGWPTAAERQVKRNGQPQPDDVDAWAVTKLRAEWNRLADNAATMNVEPPDGQQLTIPQLRAAYRELRHIVRQAEQAAQAKG